MTISGMAGVASLGGLADSGSAEAADARDYYELRAYHIDTEEQKKGLETFIGDAAIPALNRIGISPVGVFEPHEGINPIYVLLRHRSLESVATATQQLLADEQFLSKGASFLDAPASSPAYARIESSLMVAFTGMPHLETPAKSESTLFQLRIYESPSIKAGQKKIEMFNTAELDIFRKTGLTPVFFGETLVGTNMPNLTYMLAFESTAEQEAAWKRFGSDPEWRKLRAIPEYANEKIIRGITNLPLRLAACSQI
jgi:hypothetical protein